MKKLEKIAAALRQRDLSALLLTGEQSLVYATGLPGIEGACVICADGEGWLFTDSRYIEVAKTVIAPRGYHIELLGDGTYPKCVDGIARQKDLRKIGFEDLCMTYAKYQQYVEGVSCALVPAGDLVETLRAVKEQEEVDCMIAAQRIAEKSLDEVLGLIKPGLTELELAAELEMRMRKNGSEGVAFSSIVVSGPKGSLPHGTPGDRQVQAGEFITFDFGATINGY